MLLTTDAVGGVWRYSIDLARGLRERGVVPVLAVLGPPPNAAQRAEAADLKLLETGLPLDWTAETPSALAAAAAALVALSRCEAVDAAHLHAPALAGASWSVPVTAVAHSDVATWWGAVRGGALPADLAWRADACARGLARADVIVAPSRAFAADLDAIYRAPRIVVIHNGSDSSTVGGERDGSVLTAGRLWDEGKDIATIDRAAAMLHRPVYAAGAVSGPNGAAIGLRSVIGLGSLDAPALAARMARSTTYVSASRYEPFGLAVLEAARAGMALVLSDIPTHRELWDGTAAFFPPGDADALAAALRTAPGIGRALERAGRYGIGRMVDATLALHQSMTLRGAA